MPVTPVPTITGVSYTFGNGKYSIAVTAQPVTPPPGQIVATLYENGVGTAFQNATGVTATFMLPGPLSLYTAYAVSLQYQNGPSSSLVPVMVTPPTVRAVAYDGTNVTATVELPTAQQAAPGVAFQMQDMTLVGQPMVGSGFGNGSTVAFPPYDTITPTDSFLLYASALDGISQGLMGTGVPMITQTAALTTLSYDGARVSGTWTTPGNSNISSYRLHVLANDASFASASAGPANGAVEVALDPASTYTAALQGLGKANVGPSYSAAPVEMTGPIAAGVTIIAAAPAVASVTVGTSASAQIAPPSGLAAGTSYYANLYLGGQKVEGPVLATGTTPVAAFTTAVLGKSGYSIRAYAQIVSNGTTVTGPLGPAAQVLSIAPRIVSALVVTDPSDSTKFAVDVVWSLPETPNGAIATSAVTLAQGSTQVYASPALTGTSTTFSVAKSAVDTTKPVTFSVACAGASGSSPASAAVNVSFAAPALASIGNDDGEIVGQWTWAPGNANAQAAATGYRYLVYATTPARLVHVSEPTQSLTGSVSLAEAGALGLDSVSITIAVDCGVGQFRADPATALIVHRPALSGTSVSGTTLSMTMTAPSVPTGTTITGYLARFRQGDLRVGSAAIASTTSPLSVDLSTVSGLPNNALWPVTVTLAAVAGSVTGPESQALYVLRNAPSALAAEASATDVLARWVPMPGPVDGYRVEVIQTSTSTVIGSIYSPIPEALVPITAAASGQSYQLVVTPTLGGALGPPSPGLPLALLAPTLGTVSFDGGTLTLGVTAPNVGGATIGGYRATVMRNGETVATVDTATGASLAVPFSAAEPQAAYSLAVAAIAGTSVGPRSSASAFVTAVPRIVRLTSDQTSVTMTLDPSPVTTSGATLQGILYIDGVAGTPVAASNNNTVIFVLTDGTTYQVAAQAVLNGGTGPQTEMLTAIVNPPVLASTSYDGSMLAVGLDQSDADGTYLLTLTADSVLLLQAMMKGLGTTLAVDATPGTRYQLSAQQIAGIVSGPAMAPVDLFMAGCEINAMSYSGTSVTVAWNLPDTPGADIYGFEIDAINDGYVTGLAHTTGQSITVDIGTLPPANTLIAVRVSNPGPIYGPTGMPLPVLREAPANLGAYYDGRAIVARWDPVRDPNATGYTATLTVAGNTPIVIASTGTSLTYPFDLASYTGNPAISLSVMATSGLSQGPSSAVVNIRTANPAFYVGDLPNAVMPAVYPSLSVAPAAAQLVFYLPELFATHQTTAIGQGPFTLQPITPVTPPYAYTVTVPASSGLWSFADAATRQTIAAQFASFLNAIAGTTGASVQAPRIVQQTLASGLPLSFAESLGYRYSFDPQMRFVDLQAGMRLEIRYESYQYVSGSAPTNGYVTGGNAVYEIADMAGSGGTRFTAIDPFLGSLQAIGFQSPQQGGAGGDIDLQTAAYRRPYLRLFYPQSFPASQSQGSTDYNTAVALVAATDWSALDTVTQYFISFGSLPTAPSADYSIAYFRGRAVPTPLIAVSVNGASRFVALGTTLGTLLAGEGLPPDLAQVWLSGVSLARPVTPNLPTTEVNSTGIVVANRRPVMVTYQQFGAFSNQTTVLDLPLVQGDAVKIGSPGDGRP
ncbi:MAG TPA: hypothetical protein VG889_09805 [Rhizomicrobium sp.]|nr:hypothetical protein [Rhizomicrobium sp.]